jgi:hypothetical protein
MLSNNGGTFMGLNKATVKRNLRVRIYLMGKRGQEKYSLNPIAQPLLEYF